MDEGQYRPACAQEALDLLNCAAASPFDQEKCLNLLHSLRQCVLKQKVKRFSLPEQLLKTNPTQKKHD